MDKSPDSPKACRQSVTNGSTASFLTGIIVLTLWFASCRRDDIRPDHFAPIHRSAVLDSLLSSAALTSVEVDKLILPDGGNMKEFLLSLNPELDTLLPRSGDHPFYGQTGNDLKNLLITYMMLKAANAYQTFPGKYPGNGDSEPEQDKLGYVAGSSQTDLRTQGYGSFFFCPRIFGLDEAGFLRHLLEGAFLTLPNNFQPHALRGYNEALGLAGLAYELEFEEFDELDQSLFRAGDIFIMLTETQPGTIFHHYGLVMMSSDNPDALMMADCFANVSAQDCKTDVGVGVGPRLVNLTFLMADIQGISDVQYKVIRLKRKFYQPFVGQTDPQIGFNVVQYGSQIWMAEDLIRDGQYYFSYQDLQLLPHARKGICPDGWHIPTLQEWEILFNTMGAQAYPWPQGIGQLVYYYQGIGRFMKTPTGWDPPGTNLYGFNVQPRGYRDVDGVTIKGGGEIMGYWTSSDVSPDGASTIVFEKSHDDVLADPQDLKTLGYGCRCVKDVPGNNPNQCLYIPVAFHILKCSFDPSDEINQMDISPIYDQIRYLNNLFQFSSYCIEFYLACENGQPVFEVHDICDGSFSGVIPSHYMSSTDSLKYTSLYILENVVSHIQGISYKWHPDYYINVYVSLTRDGAIAALPGGSPRESAIVMPLEWIGGEAVAVDLSNNARTMSLAHEIGHFLGLHHPWNPADYALLQQGHAECANIQNQIPDVPAIYGSVFADTVYNCATQLPMRNDNIMSYGNYGVATRFTNGQILYMQNILNTTAIMSGRKELVRTSKECRF